MILVETERNFIESSSNNLPSYACAGKCKKVWWPDDLNYNDKTVLHSLTCIACGGKLIKAIEGMHFKVLDRKPTSFDKDKIKMHYASTLKDGFDLI